MAMPGTQTLRFRRPDTITPPKPTERHKGLLQDQVRRTARAPWTPSFSLAFRILVFLRFSAAMYSNIQDCDEVYNFWEPLHYLDKGVGFQTWETSPQYSIRSWAYILLHLFPARLSSLVHGTSKRQSFFALRIVLSFISSYCEARFYRSVVDHLNDRLGRYMLFLSLFSTGLWSASTAFLPSTFSMYTTLLALAFAFKPASKSNSARTRAAVLFFAIGAVVGWPFSLLLAVPFVLEELFVYGADRVNPSSYSIWLTGRVTRLFTSGVLASLVFVPVVFIDSLAYGKLSLVPWNIVRYNVFSSAERGPALYGTEPWYFYILNLLLNLNIILPLALASLPALLVTHSFDYARLGRIKHQADQSSPYTLVTTRLLPFYLWLGVLTLQPHKEERFMYPIYPLVCFNAATTIYLVRGWAEVAYIKYKSVYAASQTSLFTYLTFFLVFTSISLSSSRTLALYHYYRAPLAVSFHFENFELPRLLNVTDLLPPPPPPMPGDNPAYEKEISIDFGPIKQFGLRLCYGKEWYRFPGHYLVPDGVEVRFIKSEFNGLLPRLFDPSSPTRSNGVEGLWERNGTRIVPQGLNDLNKEELSVYVDVSTCDYLVDLDLPLHTPSPLEPRYAIDEATWARVFCSPFLDGAHSSLLTRTLYVPFVSNSEWWQKNNAYGDYCLLKNKSRVAKIEAAKWK